MAAEVSFPHEGIEEWDNDHGIHVFRLHYVADEEKGAGEQVFIPDLKMSVSPWAKSQYDAMTDKAMYLQEYEIDFSAKLGSLLYQLQDEYTLEKSFPIPASWTRYYGLDPHPVVPHASLWAAVDPWNDVWIYRELWPSKVYGKPGNIPEDDNRVSIKDYVEVVKWLESSENPENGGKGESIFKRVIDYAARSFGQGTSDDPEKQPNFQLRFEQNGLYPFEDATKDHDTGIATVNEWLKPREIEQNDGSFKKKSRLHIFSDKCPELIHQIKTNRYQQLTPLLAERQDPSGKPVAKRNHFTDILRYLLMAKPFYYKKSKEAGAWKPVVPGMGY